jgi:hypothetical protein
MFMRDANTKTRLPQSSAQFVLPYERRRDATNLAGRSRR